MGFPPVRKSNLDVMIEFLGKIWEWIREKKERVDEVREFDV
jgi:hypothetical protein